MERENRSGRGVDPALERATKAAAKLRKGDGVRRAKLHRDLGSDLRGIWHVAEDAPPHRVRAIVFLRLSDVLAALGDPGLEAIVFAAYNIRREPMAGQKAARLASLPDGLSEKTYDRRMEPFQQQLAASLQARQRVLEEHEIRRAERWFSRRPLSADTAATALISGFHREADEIVPVFLDDSWCAPADESGAPEVVPLGPLGTWLCVFPDQATLTGYRTATGAPWRFVVHRSGRELARYARARPEPTGVVVNPSRTRGSGAKAAFSLPHAVLAGLVLDPPSAEDPAP
jgi:hypothetical protein